MSIPKEIQQIFDDAVMQKTLSLEVFGAITRLKDSHDATVRQLEAERASHEATRKREGELSRITTAQAVALGEYEKRKDDLAAFEKQADRLRYTAETEVDRRKEMLGLVGLVFRSPVYKTSTQGMAPGGVPQISQYGGTQYPTTVSVNEEKTVREE